jgi:hypothetical protein
MRDRNTINTYVKPTIGVILLLLGFIVSVSIQLANPDMTPTRLWLEYPWYLVTSLVSAIIGLFMIKGILES